MWVWAAAARPARASPPSARPITRRTLMMMSSPRSTVAASSWEVRTPGWVEHRLRPLSQLGVHAFAPQSMPQLPPAVQNPTHAPPFAPHAGRHPSYHRPSTRQPSTVSVQESIAITDRSAAGDGHGGRLQQQASRVSIAESVYSEAPSRATTYRQAGRGRGGWGWRMGGRPEGLMLGLGACGGPGQMASLPLSWQWCTSSCVCGDA